MDHRIMTPIVVVMYLYIYTQNNITSVIFTALGSLVGDLACYEHRGICSQMHVGVYYAMVVSPPICTRKTNHRTRVYAQKYYYLEFIHTNILKDSYVGGPITECLHGSFDLNKDDQV